MTAGKPKRDLGRDLSRVKVAGNHCRIEGYGGTPVTAEYDPMGRKYCRDECPDAAAEAAGGAMR